MAGLRGPGGQFIAGGTVTQPRNAAGRFTSAPQKGSIQHAVGQGFHEALTKHAHKVLERARPNAPIGDPSEDEHPGALRASGRVISLPHSIEVVFDSEYAIPQHENLHWNHPQGGGPKWLENAGKELAHELEGLVAKEVREHVERELGG